MMRCWRQFPQARAHVIAGAGHWVHAEKPDAVLRAIRRYLASEPDKLMQKRWNATGGSSGWRRAGRWSMMSR